MPCGFDSLSAQSTTRNMVNGQAFNLMVVGQSGIGKTTLLNSLFNFDYGDAPDIDRTLKDVELRIKECRPKNSLLDIRITLIEAKGSDSNICLPIVDYLTARCKENIEQELVTEYTRKNKITDARIHCCIYMIPCTGLNAIDMATLKQLHPKVCIILVIAQSDALSKEERHKLKQSIREEIGSHDIEIYSPDEVHWPLAVAASNDIIDKNQRGKAYSWGTAYIERHSEFTQLRELILKTHMLPLIDHTDQVQYDRHRDEVISHFERECGTNRPPKPAKPTKFLQAR